MTPAPLPYAAVLARDCPSPTHFVVGVVPQITNARSAGTDAGWLGATQGATFVVVLFCCSICISVASFSACCHGARGGMFLKRPTTEQMKIAVVEHVVRVFDVARHG